MNVEHTWLIACGMPLNASLEITIKGIGEMIARHVDPSRRLRGNKTKRLTRKQKRRQQRKHILLKMLQALRLIAKIQKCG
jgi:hypothetical protein